MRVLVAGDRGYIGDVLVAVLEAAGHQVTGFDLGLYEGCDFRNAPAAVGWTRRDTRDAQPSDLEGFDAVVCLAALSNDPLGRLNSAATQSINVDGTLALARAAKAARVPRFVFASSCSLYGAAGSEAVAEDAAMRPVTVYGETKVDAEAQLSALADDRFSPTYMRNATAYGVSRRLRLDIVVNNLTAFAVTTGKVALQSDGTPWRPLVHIEDISRACRAILEAPREVVHDQAFNVGRNSDNLRIRDVAELVKEAVDGSVVTFAPDATSDRRDYRVDFSKLNDTFPELSLNWTVADGIAELADAYAAAALSESIVGSTRFVRTDRIRQLLSNGALDDDLRWSRPTSGRVDARPMQVAR